MPYNDEEQEALEAGGVSGVLLGLVKLPHSKDSHEGEADIQERQQPQVVTQPQGVDQVCQNEGLKVPQIMSNKEGEMERTV